MRLAAVALLWWFPKFVFVAIAEPKQVLFWRGLELPIKLPPVVVEELFPRMFSSTKRNASFVLIGSAN